MNTYLKIALGVVALVLLILIGSAIGVYRKGYYHALRGGIAQDDGDLEGAIAYFQEAYDRNPNAYMVAHDLACCYSLKNDRENCLRWLRRALETDHAESVRASARKDKDFAPFRDDPEFRALIEARPGR